jgi:hypothetical protein
VVLAGRLGWFAGSNLAIINNLSQFKSTRSECQFFEIGGVAKRRHDEARALNNSKIKAGNCTSVMILHACFYRTLGTQMGPVSSRASGSDCSSSPPAFSVRPSAASDCSFSLSSDGSLMAQEGYRSWAAMSDRLTIARP